MCMITLQNFLHGINSYNCTSYIDTTSLTLRIHWFKKIYGKITRLYHAFIHQYVMQTTKLIYMYHTKIYLVLRNSHHEAAGTDLMECRHREQG